MHKDYSSINYWLSQFISSIITFVGALLVTIDAILPGSIFTSDKGPIWIYLTASLFAASLLIMTLGRRRVVGDTVLGTTTLFVVSSFLTLACAIVTRGSPDQTALLLLSLTTGITAVISWMTFVARDLNSNS